MKVLMFGWEFPPHISGGLGTACFGLTQSLVGEKVKLTFVVPKLFGNEAKEKIQLVDAGNITIPLPEAERKPPRKILRKKEKVTYTEKPVRIIRKKENRSVTKILVESSLVPYTSPSLIEKTFSIENWNYVFEKPEPVRVTETIEEVIIEEAPVGYTYNFTGGYGSKLMEEVTQYALAGRELAMKNSHDVIHAHDWMTFPAAMAAKKATGKPLVIHVHATEFDRSGYCGGPVFEIEKGGMMNADKIVAVSQWTKDIIVSRYGISSEKIIVVHNGIFASPEKQKAEKTSLGSHVVTFLGRITHQKGPGFFVEAARKVSKSFPEAHFIVAGAGDLLPQIIERVAQLRLSQKFHFTGFLNKEWIDRIWSMSDVYVMPSVSEPFGITPLEAIQAGVPVIISNQSGVAEVMPHALKVDFWDVEHLAESICSVLQYGSLSSMLQQKGEYEIGELTWKKAAQKIKHLYEEIAT